MEKKFLTVILNESDRMTHIVQDLLTLSRFDSGRSPIHLTTFPFGTALRDLYNAVLLEAQRHGHRLTLDIPERLPAITADRERILQVMMNVVSNAVKYTPDGGRITISAGQTGSRVWMEVADNGIGIPPEDRDRIFERFYRTDSSRNSTKGGNGIGLSIVKKIIEDHGGYIWATSKEGEGTCMHFVIRKYSEVESNE
jgi:two-component system sensor histidine kinase VicK